MAEVNDLTDRISQGLISIDEARKQLGLEPWGLPETTAPIKWVEWDEERQ